VSGTPVDTLVDTPRGPGRLTYAAASRPRGVLLLSHGAGKGVESADLQALAARLPNEGWTVALFDQPWRVAGRKIATAPPTLDEGLRAAALAVRAECAHTQPQALPLVVGGRSAGARSAARCALELGAAGCLALAFPLHAPHRQERSRTLELQQAGVPTLVLQGERDALGAPAEFGGWFPGSLPQPSDLVVVPEADHAFTVPRRAAVPPAEIWALIAAASASWLARLVP
jgi:predicted alpha/beta-hydrolase family hydrolase